MKTIFFTDLDNTILYSYKHDIGNEKQCAEIYHGREISFLTMRTQALLKEISNKILIVPITTRTVEQYRRIRLGIGELPFALVCNGGVLLIDGIEDDGWYRESLEMTALSRPELKRAEALLEDDASRSFEIRNVKDLFVFTKSDRPEDTVKRLAGCLDTSVVDIFSNGGKVYAVPVELNKGNGLKRLARRLGADKTIAAGDSAFDIPMFACADYAFAPAKLAKTMEDVNGAIIVKEQEVFSEGLLEDIVRLI